MDILKTLSEELNIKLGQVESAVALLDDGNTVPFIARYRKEATGGLDDEVLRALTERLTYLRNLEARKEEVKNLIAVQEKLTDEISDAIDAAVTLTEVDDIYRPFRPKRKTRASVAKERGLEPLAELLKQQKDSYEKCLREAALAYINEEDGVPTAKDALLGACDIVAEEVSDNAEYRKEIRRLTAEYGKITSVKVGEEEAGVYEQYYEFEEKIKTLPSHRILALNRAEKEGVLKVSVVIESEILLNYLFMVEITNYTSPAFKYMARAVCDGYERLIAPSIEREIRSDMFDAASESAIKLFSDNFKHLLMGAPLRGKTATGRDVSLLWLTKRVR